MTGFDLPANFTEDPESLVRRARARLVSPSIALLAVDPTSFVPSTSTAMAQKTLREFSAPFTSQVPKGPEVEVGNGNFEIKTGLITMVHASPFIGKANEDASAHMQQFQELCNTFTIRGVSEDAIRLRLFPFSLMGRAKQWFYASRVEINTWEKCSVALLAKFFPLGKTNALCGRISSFQQAASESIPEAWERLQEYILACPHHGMDDLLILQNFYNGLTSTARSHVDAATTHKPFRSRVKEGKEMTW